MLLIKRTVALGVLLSLAATGSFAASAKELSPVPQFHKDVRALVACLLNSERPLIVKYLTERRGNIGNITNDDCFKNTASGRFGRAGAAVNADLFTGIAAELLLRKLDLDEADKLMAGAPAIHHYERMTVEKLAPNFQGSRREKEAWVAKVNHNYDLDSMGDCAVRKAPRLSRNVIFSEYDSPTERDAIAEIMPIISDCAPQVVSSTDPNDFRLFLALNYVRLASLADPSFKAKLL